MINIFEVHIFLNGFAFAKKRIYANLQSARFLYRYASVATDI